MLCRQWQCEASPRVGITSLSGGHSERVPPDSISNSEVKTLCADGSVGSPHVRVGHCQAFMLKPLPGKPGGGFFLDSRRIWNLPAVSIVLGVGVVDGFLSKL